MGTVYVDSTVGDDLRRERLFAGELFTFSPGINSAGLCSLARDMAEEAFAPHDPPVAQDSMEAEDYAKILADLVTSLHGEAAKPGARGYAARRLTRWAGATG